MTKNKTIKAHSFPSYKKQNIYICQLDDEIQMNRDLEKSIREHGDKQNQKTNVKAYMTDWRMHEKPGFNELKEISLKISQAISQERNNTNILSGKHPASVVAIWGMIYKEGDYTVNHSHWPNIWSGVYYVKVSKTLTGGELYFSELKQSFVPKEGMMVIFDSYLKHEVRKLHGKGERIAVSFNIAPS